MGANEKISIGQLMRAYDLTPLEAKRLLFTLEGSYSGTLDGLAKRPFGENEFIEIANDIVKNLLIEEPSPYGYAEDDLETTMIMGYTWKGYNLFVDRYSQFLCAAAEQSGIEHFLSIDDPTQFHDRPEFKYQNANQLRGIIFYGMVYTSTVDKKQAVIHLHSVMNRQLKRSVPDLSSTEESSIVGSYIQSMEALVSINSKEPLSPMTRGIWDGAIIEYEIKYTERGNDALPARMRILLQVLSREPIDSGGRNISRDVDIAKEKDVPKLLNIFSKLRQFPLPV